MLAGDLTRVDANEMFGDPAVQPPIKSEVVDIVFISQAIAKIRDKFGAAIDGVV